MPQVSKSLVIHFTDLSKRFDAVTVLRQPVAYNRPIMKAKINLNSVHKPLSAFSILQPRVGP